SRAEGTSREGPAMSVKVAHTPRARAVSLLSLIGLTGVVEVLCMMELLSWRARGHGKVPKLYLPENGPDGNPAIGVASPRRARKPHPHRAEKQVGTARSPQAGRKPLEPLFPRPERPDLGIARNRIIRTLGADLGGRARKRGDCHTEPQSPLFVCTRPVQDQWTYRPRSTGVVPEMTSPQATTASRYSTGVWSWADHTL